ncbi:MAG: 50S ribosomal protein L34e [Thermoprotei archaeon]|nr:MAG: 50S ribosomal protein L34e [Thermoprotei archaeon]
MPRPALRSRTIKRKIVRTPGGRLVIRILPKKHNVPKCALCKKPLQGYPKMTAKEERRGHRPPQRPYGGYLCHACLKALLKSAVRNNYPI